jgi:hypothetical protein
MSACAGITTGSRQEKMADSLPVCLHIKSTSRIGLGRGRICATSAPVLEAPRGTNAAFLFGGVSCASIAILKTSVAFEVTRKRRKSFPSETRVKRGRRFVHGDVELIEKLGRNDLCPCGSGRRLQGLLHAGRALRRRQSQ